MVRVLLEGRVMTEQEILKMCRNLAKKYKNRQEYDDLVSEGVLKCLEVLNKGAADKAALKSHARTAMQDYYNHKRKVVQVPVHGQAHSMSRDQETSNWTAMALQKALYTPSVEIREEMAMGESPETILERKQFIRHVFMTAFNCLTHDEWTIIRMRYWDGMTQDAVGKEMCHNQKWVSRREKSALEKICNNL